MPSKDNWISWDDEHGFASQPFAFPINTAHRFRSGRVLSNRFGFLGQSTAGSSVRNPLLWQPSVNCNLGILVDLIDRIGSGGCLNRDDDGADHLLDHRSPRDGNGNPGLEWKAPPP
jgi:hypothetical protein